MAPDDGWKSELRAGEVLKQLGITELPVDPFAVAVNRGIVLQENPSLSSGISGCLMKVGDVFGIIQQVVGAGKFPPMADHVLSGGGTARNCSTWMDRSWSLCP